MHDANHGSFSKNQFFNNLFGWSMNVLGSNRALWFQGHNVQHHVYSGLYKCDPDELNLEPFAIVNPYSNLKKTGLHRLQALLTIVVALIFATAEVFIPGQWTSLHKIGFHAKNHLRFRDFIINFFTKAIVLVITYHYFYYLSFGMALFYILLANAITGLITVFLFELSHHYEGTKKLPQIVAGKKICWYRQQIESSSDYGGWLACYLTGGLNYQIVHHVFPRVNSDHYPALQPLLKAVCKKHNVHYEHFPSLWDNAKSTLSYFNRLGKSDDKIHSQ